MRLLSNAQPEVKIDIISPWIDDHLTHTNATGDNVQRSELYAAFKLDVETERVRSSAVGEKAFFHKLKQRMGCPMERHKGLRCVWVGWAYT